jgi:hypothetical protein
MRADPVQFAIADQAPSREPRFVVRIQFDVSSPYITSHDDIAGVPGVVINGALQKPSAISQRIVPDEGRSEIGSFTFSLVDKESAFTDAMRDQLRNQQAGLRGKVVRFYVGYRGMDFADFQLFQTQIVMRCTYRRGVYEIICADITRELRKEVFRPVSTTLRDSVTEAQLTIPVYDTSAFELIAHGAAYSDLPSATRGYVRIESEIVRYAAKSADTFFVDGASGRGALNTKPSAHAVDATTAADRRTKVEEYIYLEGQGPHLAYQVMTGLDRNGVQILPDHWNLGIDPSFVRLSDFLTIGPDLWDPGDETKALIFRFEGLKPRDGKQFIEKELFLLLGCYSPIYSDGTLGLRRMVGVISDAAPVMTLTEREIIDLSPLEHDYQSLHNDFRINWAFEPLADDFLRTTGFYDAESIAIHGRSSLLTYDFHGLHSQRATDSTIAIRLDAIRDRYSQPPQTINATIFGSLNRIEVGDIVRILVPDSILRDFVGDAGEYNRSFEVQQKSYRAHEGSVDLELFGSTARPDSLPTTPTAVTPLPDAFYSAAGTALSSVVTIASGTAMPGNYTLTGNADLTNSASIFYYLGDLTIASGCNITLAANVQLRVMGFLTVNGTINGVGGGQAGVSDPGTGDWDATFAGNPGIVGHSRGWDGIYAFRAGRGPLFCKTIPAVFTRGLYDVLPFFTLAVSGNELLGLPTDLRGTGGAPGGRYKRPAVDTSDPDIVVAGIAGAAGGAGFCLICRGMAPGAGATINLSGASPATPTTSDVVFPAYAGAGGAGSPGGFLLLLDGNTLSIPVITGKFVASTGTITQPGTAMVKATQMMFNPGNVSSQMQPRTDSGYQDPSVISALDMANAAHRIQYIPVSQDANPDEDITPPAPIGLVAGHVFGGNAVTWTNPGLDQFDVIEVYASIDNDRTNSVKVGETRASSFLHSLPLGGLRYYWARAKVNPISGRPALFSEWEPLSATAGESSNIETPGEVPDAPDDITGTGMVNAIRFQWSLPAYAKLAGELEIYEGGTGDDFEDVEESDPVWAGYGLSAVVSKDDDDDHRYWLVLNRSGIRSDPSPIGGIVAAAASVTATLVAYATPPSVSISATLGANPRTAITPPTEVTASGGTGPYTYAWTWLSGGTGITIDFPTFNDTTFTATNNLDGTILTGTARCTVTDDASATATVDVEVLISFPSVG